MSLKNNDRGFLLTDTVAAFSVFLTIALTLIPITAQLKLEEYTLSQRRNMQSVLHDELLEKLWKNPALPISYNKVIDNQTVHFTFSTSTPLTKGCVAWNNAKNQEEKLCLYGYPY